MGTSSLLSCTSCWFLLIDSIPHIQLSILFNLLLDLFKYWLLSLKSMHFSWCFNRNLASFALSSSLNSGSSSSWIEKYVNLRILNQNKTLKIHLIIGEVELNLTHIFIRYRRREEADGPRGSACYKKQNHAKMQEMNILNNGRPLIQVAVYTSGLLIGKLPNKSNHSNNKSNHETPESSLYKWVQILWFFNLIKF